MGKAFQFPSNGKAHGRPLEERWDNIFRRIVSIPFKRESASQERGQHDKVARYGEYFSIPFKRENGAQALLGDYRLSQTITEFPFPSNGKPDRKSRFSKRVKPTRAQSFHSLQTGKCIVSGLTDSMFTQEQISFHSLQTGTLT